MNILSLNRRSVALRVSSVVNNALIFELRGLGGQSPLGTLVISMVVVFVLNGADLVLVLLWKDLSVLYRLYSSVIVILVDFLVYGRVHFFMLCRFNCLSLDGWLYRFMDSRFMMAGLAYEVLDRVLSFVHVA